MPIDNRLEIDRASFGTTTLTALTTPCEFNTCPTGSPATGFNVNDTRLNNNNLASTILIPGTVCVNLFHPISCCRNSDSGATDVETRGTDHLTTESSVMAKSGCFATVSVFNATTKADVNAATQGIVLAKFISILACSN
ncbi:hypothetical protein B0H16DRAFT_1659510 [Mycena metata]|uniref:Uncharacterized protein n=1 Tax=Mycena metata TaxID=1033252 RepID=A0AAD7K758_9AGAR|nr:hypothetical protein B0H16DRAFT_1659510 [Mycena metata]